MKTEDKKIKNVNDKGQQVVDQYYLGYCYLTELNYTDSSKLN